MTFASFLSSAPELGPEWLRESLALTNGKQNGQVSSLRRNETENSSLPSEPWGATIQRIESFFQLGDDWDGLGAKAPEHELLKSAVGLAYLFSERGVPAPVAVVPGLDGSVNFEWQEPDGTIAEVEIDRPFHAEVMLIEPGKSPSFWRLPTEAASVDS